MNKPKLTMVKNTVVFIICLIIATCVCKELFKKYLTYNVPVSYDIKFEGFNGNNVNLDVFYTLDSNKNFSEKQKIRKVLTNIANNEWQTVSVNIPTQRKEKINLIRIDMGDYPNSQFRPSRIFIKNIMVKGKEITSLQAPKDLALNHAKQDTITNETADEISFRIENRDPFFIFKKPFNLRGAWFSGLFDNSISNSQLILFGIATALLTFLLFLAVSKVLLIQQNNKTSYANVALIILVAVTILIPASKIDYQSTKSETENRMLAIYKPIVKNNAINETYGKDFESWFNDRFNYRSLLYKIKLSIVNKLNIVLSNKQSYKYGDWIWVPRDFPQFSKQSVLSLVDKSYELSKRWNAPVLLLIIPSKSEVYCDFSLQKKCVRTSQLLYQYINEYSNFKHFPSDRLQYFNVTDYVLAHKSHENLVYFKDEHHLTQSGNQLIIDALIQGNFLPKTHNNFHKYGITSDCISGEFDIPMKQGLCVKHGQSYAQVLGNRWNNNSQTPIDSNEQYIYYQLSKKYQKDVKRKKIIWSDTIYKNKEWCTILQNNSTEITHKKILVVGNSFIESLSRAMSTRYSDIFRFRVSSGTESLGNTKSLDHTIINLAPELIIIPIHSPTIIK